MLRRRSRSPAAIRARARRARQRDGIAYDLKVRIHTRRLIAVLRAIAWNDEGRRTLEADPPTHAETEYELNRMLGGLVARWFRRRR
jgi:hypothetical protein